MDDFNKGDVVEYTRKSNGKVERATVAWYSPTFKECGLVLDSTGAEVEMPAHRLTLIQVAPKVETQPVASLPRYDCLECGLAHSATVCPACGGEDKIDHIEPLADTEQATVNSAQKQQAERNALIAAAAKQPVIQSNEVPSGCTRFTVQQDSYWFRYFLMHETGVFYVENAGGYVTAHRIDDAALAEKVRVVAS